MSSKTTRVQIELPEKSMQRLRGLKEATEAASYAEVFRNAMMIYSWMLDLHENGSTVSITDKDGASRDVEVFTLG